MSNEFIKRVLSSMVIIPLAFFIITQGSLILYTFIIILFGVSSYEWQLMTKNKSYKNYGFLFLFFSFYAFYELSNELFHIFFIIIICISTDIGGYVFGKLFKGPKLTKVSPKKTYAGVLGGYFLSLISSTMIIIYVDYSGSLIKYLFITILISTVSQLGDLIISYFKRLSKIKNTGKLIPGHGGLLDRIDGMLFVFPIYFLVFLTGFSII
jgi:phosphatidate cytidylyltransferase